MFPVGGSPFMPRKPLTLTGATMLRGEGWVYLINPTRGSKGIDAQQSIASSIGNAHFYDSSR